MILESLRQRSRRAAWLRAPPDGLLGHHRRAPIRGRRWTSRGVVVARMPLPLSPVYASPGGSGVRRAASEGGLHRRARTRPPPKCPRCRTPDPRQTLQRGARSRPPRRREGAFSDRLRDGRHGQRSRRARLPPHTGGPSARETSRAPHGDRRASAARIRCDH